jgi:hypothetical protein
MEIIFRTVIEVLGKPQEHIEATIKEYVRKLRADESFTVLRAGFAKAKQQEEGDLWTKYAELEIKTESFENLMTFCFEYMPSVVEVVSPAEFKLKDVDMTNFFTDLQAKLHNVDMVAKQVKMENDFMKRNMGALLRNYVHVLLQQGPLSSEQLRQFTGLEKDKMEDFLDKQIDEGNIDLTDGLYHFKEEIEVQNGSGSQAG